MIKEIGERIKNIFLIRERPAVNPDKYSSKSHVDVHFLSLGNGVSRLESEEVVVTFSGHHFKMDEGRWIVPALYDIAKCLEKNFDGGTVSFHWEESYGVKIWHGSSSDPKRKIKLHE